MIKVRITPVLKALGFKFDKNYDIYRKDLIYGARLYLLDEGIRAIEIWKDIYNGNGEFKGCTLIIKNFVLDDNGDKIDFYWDIFIRLSFEFNAPILLDRFNYYIGREKLDTLNETTNGFLCNIPKMYFQTEDCFLGCFPNNKT